MSNPTPRPASPVHPTRQQLDDLEELMQRMLALPVNQLDEPGGVAALPSLAPLPEWESAPLVEIQEEPEITSPAVPEMEADVVSTAERMTPAEADTETRRQGDTETRGEEDREPGSAEDVPVPEWVGPVVRTPMVVRLPGKNQVTKKPVVKEKEPSGPVPPGLSGPFSSFPVRDRAAPANRPRRPMRDRPGLGMRLLLWSNRAFDRTVGRWGGIGRWLRGRHGRALLGLTGLLLLIAAAVLGVLDWIGWTW